MIVAYLINQYPKVSHSFIRREIAAVAARGIEVRRFSIRRCDGPLPDPADQTELTKTIALLDRGVIGLVVPTLIAALTSPLAFARCLRAAWVIGRRSDRGLSRHAIYVMEACRLRRELQRCRAEHLHVHFGTNGAAVAMLCRLLGGPPYSVTIHGPEEFDKPEFLALGEKIRHAAFTIAICQYGRSQLFRWCSFDTWPRIHIVRCGVDRQFLDAPRPPVPAAPRLVCVARLCEPKGQLRLIEAAHRLALDGVAFELVFAGDGPLRGDLEAAIQRFGLKGRVRITGYLSGERVREELLAARAMVLPSFAEGLPVAVMEAMAVGRPVISTYVAGLPELVEPGVNGWLVPASSVEALAQAMQDALSADPAELETMGRRGAERVRADHDIDRAVEPLVRLFRGDPVEPEPKQVHVGKRALLPASKSGVPAQAS